MNDIKWVFIFTVMVGLTGILNGAGFIVLNARVKLLEAQKKEVVIENRMLARKLGEVFHENRGRFVKMECQTDLAVAGSRMGHYKARKFARQGGFKSCNQLKEIQIGGPITRYADE